MATALSEVRSGSTQTDTVQASLMQMLTSPKTKRGIQSLAGAFMTPERFLRLALNAVSKTPKLLECEPNSVIGALMTAAALGLEPNTVQQQAFLIPYKKSKKVGTKWVDAYECQFQIGYRGFITLAHRSSHIDKIEAEAIHQNDVFEHMQGTESFLRYKKALTNRGALIGAFCYVRLTNGNEMTLVLPVDDIEKIKGKSETLASLKRAVDESKDDYSRAKAQKKLDETPWVLWEDDMAAKSVIKKMAKFLPLTPGEAFSAAAQLDADNESGNTIDMRAMADADKAKAIISGDEDISTIEHRGDDDDGVGLEMPSMTSREAGAAQMRGTEPEPEPEQQAAYTARSAARRRTAAPEASSDFGGLD